MSITGGKMNGSTSGFAAEVSTYDGFGAPEGPGIDASIGGRSWLSRLAGVCGVKRVGGVVKASAMALALAAGLVPAADVAAAQNDVLIIAADHNFRMSSVKAALDAIPEIGTVEIFNSWAAGPATVLNASAPGVPTLAYLQTKGSVLVWSHYPYMDSVALGNVLADYVDAGGGVVCAAHETGTDHATNAGILAGRWAGPLATSYQAIQRIGLFKYPSTPQSWDQADPLEHFILNDVATFAAHWTVNPQSSTKTPQATQIATYAGGTGTMVATRSKGRGRVVDLGFYPVPAVAYQQHGWTGDGARLIANSLLYGARLDVEPIDVLLLSSDAPAHISAVKEELDLIPEIGTVEIFNSSSSDATTLPGSTTPGLPTLEYLKNFDAVLVWCVTSNHAQPVLLGDVLADYYDGGGGVVCGAREVSGIPTRMQGRWAAGESYHAIRRICSLYSAPRSWDGQDPLNHDILAEVPAFTARVYIDPNCVALATDAIGVGSFNAGGAMVVTRPAGPGTGEVVDLGFYPVPDSGHASHGWTGGGGRLIANALRFAAESDDSDTNVGPDSHGAAFPPVPFYLQVNSPESAIGLGDWYSASTGGNGANIVQIHVPLDWPAGHDMVVDLLSPDMNDDALSHVGGTETGRDGNPRDENTRPNPVDPSKKVTVSPVQATTTFELYGPGVEYSILTAPAGEIVVPAGEDPDDYLAVDKTTGDPVRRTYLPNSVTHGQFDRLATIENPVPGGVYVLRTMTANSPDVANETQNGFRVAAGYDDNGTVTADVDGDPNSGDEIFISTPGQTLEHNITGSQGLTFYRHVPPGQDVTRFHNFDYDRDLTNKPNEAVAYYAPSDVVDETAKTGDNLGSLSLGGRWNNGGTQNGRVGDPVATLEKGYWKIRMVVNLSNQFNLETEPGQPMFAVLPPTPTLTVTKTFDQLVVPGEPFLSTNQIRFRILVENNTDPTDGGGTAKQVVVTDPIPAGHDYVSHSATAGDVSTSLVGGVPVFTIPEVAPGESRELLVIVEVNDTVVGPEGTNVVTVDYVNSIGDPFRSVADVVFLVNGPPSLAPGDLEYITTGNQPEEDEPFTISADDLLDGAADPEGAALTVVIDPADSPEHGTVVVNPDGSITYTPAEHYDGPDEFSYYVVDDYGQRSASRTVKLDVLAVNDPPEAGDFSTGSDEDTVAIIDVTPYVSDPDVGDSWTLVDVTALGNTQSVTIVDANAGTLEFVPVPDFSNGNAWFTYTVRDAAGEEDTGTVTVWITNLNDDPVANEDPDSTNEAAYTTLEDTPLFVSFANRVLRNDTDADPGDTLTAVLVEGPENGRFGPAGLTANGTFRYFPNADFFGEDTFTYRAYDDTSYSNITTVTITVTPVNDAPRTTPDSYLTQEDHVLTVPALTGLLENDYDVDDPNTSMVARLHSNPSHGGVTVNPDGSFVYSPQRNFSGSDSFEYRVSDPHGAETVETVYITIGPLNDRPRANADQYSIDEGEIATGNLLANDTDPENDVTTAALITPPAHGVAVVEENGDFTYTPYSLFFNGEDTFTYQAYDMYSMSRVTVVTITVRSVNNVPETMDDEYTIREDEVLRITAPGVLGNDKDADLDPLTAIIGPMTVSNGHLVLNGDGGFVYRPDRDYNGPDEFNYYALDGSGARVLGTVSINVTPRNDAPVAVDDDQYTVAEDGVLNVSVANGVLANDTDVDNDPLTAVLVRGPLNGTLVGDSNGRFRYTPNTDFDGTDTFTYQARDGELLSNMATVTIRVIPSNDPPTARPDFYSTGGGTTLSVDAAYGVLGNDFDVDGDEPLRATLLTDGSEGGSVTLRPDGSFDYTPLANFDGEETFTYTVTDPSGATAEGTVAITVGIFNSAPVARPDSFWTNEGTLLVRNVLDNDTDDGNQPLTAHLVTGPTRAASFSLNETTGEFEYTPVAYWYGTDSFTYYASDGVNMSAVVRVQITVREVNDPPVAVDDTTYSVNEDEVLRVPAPGVLWNDRDPDNDPLMAAIVTQPSNGRALLLSNGALIYEPNPDFDGPEDSFTYAVSDGRGGTATATVRITVRPVNDAPVGVSDEYDVDEDGGRVVLWPFGVLANDYDVDTPHSQLRAVLVDGPSSGRLLAGILAPRGSFTYIPDDDFAGTDYFTYYVTDGQLNSEPVVVTLNVINDPDAPVALDDSYDAREDTPLHIDAVAGVLHNDSDPDDDIAFVVVTTQPRHGSVNLDNATGAFVYTPDADFRGQDSFVYTVTDATGLSDSATVTIDVGNTNDAPVAVRDFFATDEGVTLTDNVLSNDRDADGDDMRIQIVSGPQNGTLDVNPAVPGEFTYTPRDLWNGNDFFRYQAIDVHNEVSNIVRVDILVRPVNNDPVPFEHHRYTVYEDEVLRVAAPGLLVGATDPDQGDVLTVRWLSGPNDGTVTVNADGSFVYTPNADWNGSDWVTYEIHDGNGGVATATMQIDVIAVNDAPVARADEYTVIEDEVLTVPVADGLLKNDTDVDTPHADLRVVRTSLPAHGTLTGPGPLGAFVYRPNADFAGTDSFTYYATDSQLNSEIVTVTLNVTNEPDAPVARDDSYDAREDTPLHIDAVAGVLWNDSDPDDDIVSVVVTTQPGYGSVNLDNATGAFVYTPDADFRGQDSFVYELRDATGLSDTATVTIDVGNTNDAPVAVRDFFATNEGVALTENLLSNDRDADGDDMRIQIVSGPLHGTLDVNPAVPGEFTYSPNPFWNGNDFFRYQAIDVHNEVSNIVRVDILVRPVNNDPVPFANHRYTIDEDEVLRVAAPGLLVGATDPDQGDVLTVRWLSGPNDGTVTVNADGSFVYTPNADWNGSDWVTYEIHDGNGGVANATMQIDVIAVNDAPVAVPDEYDVEEDGARLVLWPFGVLANDYDVDTPHSQLRAVLVDGPSNGRLLAGILAPRGSFTYIPDDDFAGTDYFTYYVTDGQLNSEIVTVTLNVINEPDAPVALDDSYDAHEDTPLVIGAVAGVLANDSDPDDDIVSVVVTRHPLYGTVFLNNATGAFIYTPQSDFVGIDTFEYVLTDATGLTDTATVSIDVGGVNDAPVGVRDFFSTMEDVPLTENVLTNDTDADDGDVLTIQIVSGPLNGSLELNPAVAGEFTYTPRDNWNGVDFFRYQAVDNHGEVSAITLVQITVHPDNDPPVPFANLTYTVYENDVLRVVAPGLLVGAYDPDQDQTLTVSQLSGPDYGTAQINGDGSFVYTPNENWFGTDYITFEVHDGNGGVGTATATITVIEVNYPPIANPDTYETNEDTTLSVDAANGVLANDVERDDEDMEAHLVRAPFNGVLVGGLNPDGSFEYQPNANFNGEDSFTYYVTDTEGNESEVVRVTITVHPINDAPVVANDVFHTNEDQVLRVGAPGVLVNDEDVDGDALSVVLVNTPDHGTLDLNTDGSFTYTPNLNWSGMDTFHYKVSDGTTESAQLARVRIYVAGVADAPVAVGDVYRVDEDTTLTVVVPGVLGNDWHPDFGFVSPDPVLRAELVSPPLHGTLVLGARGRVEYRPYPDFHGTDSFTYQVSDGSLISAPAEVVIHVTSVEDLPVALPNAYAVRQDQSLSVAAPGVLADDRDGDGDVLHAVLGTSNTLYGMLTLSPDGGFVYAPNRAFEGTDVFSYFAVDGKGNMSLETTVTLVVGGVNEAPVAVDDVYSTGTEDSSLSIGAPGVLFNDTDPENDVLTATLVHLPQHGTVVLNEDGSFTYVPFAHHFGPDFFTYKASDGELDSNIARVVINTQPVVHAPVAIDDAYVTLEDTVLEMVAPGVLANDFDRDGGPVSVSMTSAPLYGSVVVSPDGGFVYTPAADWNSEMDPFGLDPVYDVFGYVVTNASGTTASASVRVFVQSVIDTPVARDDAYTLLEDTVFGGGAVPVTVLANDTFEMWPYIGGPGVSVVFVQDEPDHGVLVLDEETGFFTYEPVRNFFGTDSFTYVIASAHPLAPAGMWKLSAPATVTLTVTGVNDVPVVRRDAYVTNEDEALVVAAPGVLANDTDADGDVLRAVLQSQPSSGTLSLSDDGGFVYTPYADVYGVDEFTYYAVDGQGGVSGVTTATITIRPVNDAPVSLADVYVTDEDTTLTVAAPGVLGNDVDPDGDPIEAELVSHPLYGSLVFQSSGRFRYVPDANFFGEDSFTYRVTDGTLWGAPVTVTIHVRPVEDRPVANDDAYSVMEGGVLEVSAPGVLSNDVDADGDGLSAVILGYPSSGDLRFSADGGFVYTPAANFNGRVTFTYEASDGNGVPSAAATVVITVGEVNTAPIARDDVFLVFEDRTTTITTSVLSNDFDYDDTLLTATLVSGPLHGSLVFETSGTFVYTPRAHFTGEDSFLYQASDGVNLSNVARVTLLVEPVNDVPLANEDYYSTDEGKVLEVASPGVLANDTDADGERISAIIRDNPTSGVVRLSADGGFVYTPNPTFFGEDVFTYTVTDGHSQSMPTTVTIFVRPVNDLPVVLDDTYDTDEDTTLTVAAPGVLGNDTDADGDVLSAVVLVPPARGALVLDEDGGFEYVPALNFWGTDTFVYRAFDGIGFSEPATVTIRVREVVEAPVAVSDEYSTAENQALTVAAPGILGNDSSPDGRSLTAVLRSNPSGGTLELSADGGFVYTPYAGWNGVDVFTYVADDGRGQSDVTTVTLTVGAVNDAPFANDDEFNVREDAPTQIAAPGVLANDTDIDDTVLTATLVTQPLYGLVSLGLDGGFVYTPAPGYTGQVSFTYQASDGRAKSNVATVVLNVLRVQSAPVANADAYVTNEETPLHVGAPGVLLNDWDANGDALTAVLVNNASGGTVELSGDGGFVYTPNPGFSGNDAFTYQATDLTSASAVTVVRITVRAVNDRPVAMDDSYSVDEDTTLTVVAPGLLQNDYDEDGDSLTVELLTRPVYGDLVISADGWFRYVPNPNYSGEDSFTYRAVDTGGLVSEAATVRIQVLAVADVPVARADFYSTRENTAVVAPAPGVLANDTDADGDELSAVQVDAPEFGELVFPGDGSFIYTPDAAWSGVDTFTYIATDGLNISDVTTVTITVGPVNDAPVAVDDVFNVFEDTPTTVPARGVLANDTDVDDDVLSATLVNGPLHGTVVLRADGSFTYDPFDDYSGPDRFTYQAWDGLALSNVATVVINVVAVRDAPLGNPDHFVVDENQDLVVEAPGVLGNDFDADGEALSAVLQSEPANGTIRLASDGGFIYTPDEHFNGEDAFVYFANDGVLSSEATTVTITVRARNERPAASDDVYEVDEDEVLEVAAPGVLANDRDSDGDALEAVLETLPLNGVVTLAADGGFVYRPRADFNGTDSFTYRAFDGTAESGAAVVTIRVRPVNDPPVARGDNYFTQEDTQLIVAAPGVLADDTDADGDVLSAVLVDSVSYGVLVLSGDGSFVYTPNRDFSGTDRFTYRASDGQSVSEVVTVTITVGVVNDVPVAEDDAYRLFEDTVFVVPAPGVLANDSDGDGDELGAQLVTGPLYGELELRGDGGFTYTPMDDFTGQDWFTYQATDGMADSNIVTVMLTVVARQDVPLANDDFYSTSEEKPLVVAAPGVLGNDVDADGETLTALLEDNPVNGTVELNGDGSFVYTPAVGFHGTDTFTYRAHDGRENSEPATVTIRVSPVNDPPVAVDDIYEMDEDTQLVMDAVNGVLANDYDLDGDALEAVLINQPLNGSVVLGADGGFTYTPRENFSGEDYFTYRAWDGQDWSNPVSRVVIRVRPVQDRPVGVDDMYSVPEDKVLVVRAPGVLGNDSDADGERLTAILVNAPEHGVVDLAADGGFVYTPDHNYFGTDTFTYYANDGTENSELVTVTILVGGRNDGPVAVNDLYYTPEDTELAVPAPGILGNDVDDDGDVLQAVLITPPLHGTLSLQPSGAFVYMPNEHYSGEDRFVYRASDGLTLSQPATVRIIVTEVNDLPVLSNVVVTGSVYESQTAVLTADLYDADPSDSFLVTVDWGDGTAPSVQSYPAGTSRIFVSHLYADDNPTETPVDVNQVRVTVQDSRGGADNETRQVTVRNLPPVLENVTLTQVIPTGGTARLQGQIKDMGLEDTFALGVWWGDGHAEVHNFGTGGLHNFDLIHTYAVPGTYSVLVGVMDDDTDIAIATPSINVRNTADLALTMFANPDPASVGEHVTYTMIVTNHGPDVSRNTVLMSAIPANVEVLGANPAFYPADGILNWFLGDVPAGQTYRVDLVVKTLQQGPLHNVAMLVSEEIDPVPGNNTAHVTTTVGWLPDGPDLQAQAVTLDQTCKMTKKGPQCTLNLWVLIANRGNQMANAFVYSAYLSDDAVLSADDLKMFTRRIDKMKPGQVKGRNQTFKPHVGMNITGKYLIVVLDEGNLVFEGNETNNLVIQGPLP